MSYKTPENLEEALTTAFYFALSPKNVLGVLLRVVAFIAVMMVISAVGNNGAYRDEIEAWHLLHEEFVSEPTTSYPYIILHDGRAVHSKVEDVRKELIRLAVENGSLRVGLLAELPEACRARSYHERTRHLSDECWEARRRQAREMVR